MTVDEAALAAIKADSRVVWIEDVLRFGDTDMNGHINNATFSVLCESGRVNLFRQHMGLERGGDQYFVLAHLTIDFKGELHYPGRVRTGTWIRRVGWTSIGLGQVLLGADGRVAATSEAVCVSMAAASRRPAPFPDSTRTAIDALLRPDLDPSSP